MTGEREPTHYLSADEMHVVKFAVRRQITRLANKPDLSPEQRAQRAKLQQVLHVLNDDAFAGGCDLHVPGE